MKEHITLPCIQGIAAMHQSGASLQQTFYSDFPLIFLSGELGTGKTSFVQGLAQGLGITDPVTSPTFTLEQRYRIHDSQELLHIDLYRFTNTLEADAFLRDAREECNGICCVEWPERLSSIPEDALVLTIKEQSPDARTIDIIFNATPLPSVDQIEQWYQEVQLPENVQRHCRAVADVTAKLADALITTGTIVRKELAVRAALAHDLLRFVDFKTKGKPDGEPDPSPEQKEHWARIKEEYPDMRHEEACAMFMVQRGYNALGSVIESHGVLCPLDEPLTTEQKLLFYADKRVIGDKLVRVEERFEDFDARYGPSPEREQWYRCTKDLEALLFPGGAPL